MVAEVNIYPNNGIDYIKIGKTLFEIVNLLKENRYDDEIEFKFNDNLTFLIVYLSKKDVNLIFESFSQRLVLIEIILDHNKSNGSRKVEFRYKNEIIDKFNFKLIYNRYFGPTCQGYFDSQNNSYFLSYCGLTFKFNNIQNNNISNEILNTIKKDFTCSSIFIYTNIEKDGKNFLWTNYSNLLSETLKLKPSIEYMKSLKKLVPEIDSKEKIKINHSIYDYNSKNKLIIKFNHHPLNLKNFEIQVGVTTMQEMIRVFGFPQDTILKRKVRSNNIQMKKFKIKYINKVDDNNNDFTFTTSRSYLPCNLINPKLDMKKILNNIDNINNTVENFSQEVIKIHNYFSFGIDVIYDLNVSKDGSNIVSKLILHQNNFRSVDFLKYEKLPIFFSNNNNNLESNLKFTDLTSLFSLSKLPVFLDRKEYNIQEDFQMGCKETDRIFEFIDIEDSHSDGDNFTDTDNNRKPVEQIGNNNGDFDDINDDTSESSDLKYWGLTDYDYCNGAIFEAICNNGELCTITIY